MQAARFALMVILQQQVPDIICWGYVPLYKHVMVYDLSITLGCWFF